MLQPHDKDMVVMVHEIEYIYQHQKRKIVSYLKVLGESNTQTAMAKTVGLPLGIAASLILKGELIDVGLQTPTKSIYYNGILPILKDYQIYFLEADARIQ
jgi:saccharopine dehydrogenase-like NADP-dependent oxidoreductase